MDGGDEINLMAFIERARDVGLVVQGDDVFLRCVESVVPQTSNAKMDSCEPKCIG